MSPAHDAPPYWELEYNPRWRILDSQRHFDAWHAQAALARDRLGGLLDIPYGPHPRERLDLFRAASPSGTLIFIHGGYWRAFGKEAQSWIAEAFVREGITVAIPSYPLAPTVPLAAIVTSVTRACAHLRDSVLTGQEQRRVVVAGHSAGAHLAACLLASTPGAADAIVCISGIFDLLPLLHTQMLGGMGWTPAQLHAVSPLFMPAPAQGRVILAVGGEESEEFHSQSIRLARAWAPAVHRMLRPAGRHHYTIVEGLNEPDFELRQQLLALFH